MIPSFITNPGGRRFVIFMQNLSQFVLLFSLKTQQDSLHIKVPSTTKNLNYKICTNILESVAVYKREENRSTCLLTSNLQYEAEKKARELSNELTDSWVTLEKLKLEKETVFNAPDENNMTVGLDNLVNQTQELGTELVSHQCIDNIFAKIKEKSKKVETSFKAIQSAVAVDPSSLLVLDGSKLGCNLSGKHFDTSPQLKYLSSKVYIGNKMVLTTMIAMASEWFSMLYAAMKKKNVQMLSKHSSHLALEKLSHVLDQHVTTTDEMYSVLVTLAPIVYRNVDNIVQRNKSDDEGVWNWVYEILPLLASPPFFFNVESTLNSTKNNYESHTLHLSPTPNRFESYMKDKINKYLSVTPNIKLESSVNEGLNHSSSTVSKAKFSGSKCSAIPLPKSTRSTSVFASKYGLDRVTNSPSYSFPNCTVTNSENILQSPTSEQSIGDASEIYVAIDQSLFSPLNCSEMKNNRSIKSASLSFNALWGNDSLSDSNFLQSQTDFIESTDIHKSPFAITKTPEIKPRSLERAEVPQVDLLCSAPTPSMSAEENHLPESKNLSNTRADDPLPRTPTLHPDLSSRRRSIDRVIERYRQIKASQIMSPSLVENSET